ncbi:efflux transporter outer membrane subunit [Xylophilus rhododendri]|uniref:Efflux transporter outer membrane subunit n=1 Tax=Xylophilus rhododendri TaxID=2697032 RepID=A0A857J6X3_9BURK|nr:efflux transporter outer membrane subunit [Xylophilus rhododendri]QHI99586.1 efflux transporter outer membrane subunit [Xylophilus rhododendri]
MLPASRFCPALPARRGGLAVLALAAGLLAGCASPAVPRLPTAGLPAGWAHAPATPPGAAAPALQSWWKNLGDARLDALVDEALAQNLDVAVARSRLRQARRLAERSNAPYLPSVSGNVRTLQDVSATDSFLHASLDVSWELGLFGMRESAQRLARAELDSSEAALQAARVSVVSEVVHQYLTLRAAQRQAELLDHLLRLDGRAIDLSAARLRSRVAENGEDEEAAARRSRTAAMLPTARQAAVQASQALSVLLGRAAPDAAWSEAAALPTLGPVAIDQLPADLLRTRPDVRQAEAAVLQAAGEAGVAQAELYPRVSFGASFLYAFNITQNRRTSSNQVPAVGPFIDLPLFDWGQRRARADAKDEALQASLLSYRQTVLQGVSEAEVALSALEQQRERLARLTDASAAQKRRARSQRSLLASGLASEYEQLAFDRAALQAEAERSGAQAAQALAFVDLYKALGGAPLPAAEQVSQDGPR